MCPPPRPMPPIYCTQTVHGHQYVLRRVFSPPPPIHPSVTRPLDLTQFYFCFFVFRVFRVTPPPRLHMFVLLSWNTYSRQSIITPSSSSTGSDRAMRFVCRDRELVSPREHSGAHLVEKWNNSSSRRRRRSGGVLSFVLRCRLG